MVTTVPPIPIWLTLCNIPFLFFPSRCRVSFATTWIWANLVTCFDQWNAADVMNVTSKGRSREVLQLLLLLSWNPGTFMNISKYKPEFLASGSPWLFKMKYFWVALRSTKTRHRIWHLYKIPWLGNLQEILVYVAFSFLLIFGFTVFWLCSIWCSFCHLFAFVVMLFLLLN